MEEITPNPYDRLFNSPIETGFRALVILDALYPAALDLNELVLFDHLIVHTADFDGPPSLHPDLPPRTGEPLVRRRLVENGLSLMRMRHLVDIRFTPQGILYQASDNAAAIIHLAHSNYARKLIDRGGWLANQHRNQGSHSLQSLVTDKIGRWRAEFQQSPQLPLVP